MLVVTDIYPAGEPPIEGVTGGALAGAIREHGHRDATYVAGRDAVIERVAKAVRPGDMVITLGAGDVWKVGPALLGRL